MQNTFTLICLCVIGLILGCNTSKNNKKSNAADTSYVDSLAMKNDSLPPPPKPGPSPGHARIRAELADIEEVSPEYRIITFYVTKVEGYGPSTPPLAVQDSVKVRADKSIIDKKEISLGKIVTAVISYRQFVLGEDTSPRWTLVTLD